jgi:hypothetical protein
MKRALINSSMFVRTSKKNGKEKTGTFITQGNLFPFTIQKKTRKVAGLFI